MTQFNKVNIDKLFFSFECLGNERKEERYQLNFLARVKGLKYLRLLGYEPYLLPSIKMSKNISLEHLTIQEPVKEI